jgi:GTPase involved in cell partitioning and DNA repair
MARLGGEFGTTLHRAQTNAHLISTNSIDDIINGEDAEVSEEAWKAELNTRMEQISNTKRSSTEGRTESLTAYAHILMARYANDEIESHMGDLLPSIIKSIRQETTEREAVAALKGMRHFAITHGLC